MHDTFCKSRIVLTSYPPQYQECDCGYEEPPVQGDHHPYCFPAIRDVRTGDWGPDCFTCHVLAMAEERGREKEREAAADRVRSIPPLYCYPNNPLIQMIEKEEAVCGARDILPIGVRGYKPPTRRYE